MNSWLKLALYAFIGIIIGSFALGILAPNNGFNVYTDMGLTPGRNMMEGSFPGFGPGNGMNWMPGPMGMGGMNRGGMGMH